MADVVKPYERARRRWHGWHHLVALGPLLTGGCYQGVAGSAAEGGSSGGSSPGASDPTGDVEDEDGPEVDASCVAPARIWKLTPRQYDRTVAAMIPGAPPMGDQLFASLPDENKIFTNEAGILEMTETHVDRLFSVSSSLADAAMADPAALHPCLAEGLEDASCVEMMLDELLPKAFRRPPTDEERERYLGFFEGQQAEFGGRDALWQTLRIVLMSPDFLYRTELGEPSPDDQPSTTSLTSHERASALAYLLLDGPPDAELRRAADDGELETIAQLEAQVMRLLGTEAGIRGVQRFFGEYLDSDGVLDADKDTEQFERFTPELVTAMAEEPGRFIAHVLQQEDARLATLLSADYSVVDPQLAQLYGAADPPAEGFAKTSLPADQRSGLLTQAAFLSVFATFDRTDPIRRGLFIREALLCAPLALPDGLDVPFPPEDPDLTQRENLRQHAEDPACAACHDLMDPLGFAFEHYDAIGGWRDTENGKPVDASGAVLNTVATNGEFDGAIELTRMLADSPEVHACVLRHMYQYVHGRRASAADQCALEPLEERFAASGGDLVDLIVGLVTHPSFTARHRE